MHLGLSGVFGHIFGLIALAVPGTARTGTTLVRLAGAYGLLLWLVNYYAVAPAAGWRWLPERSDPVVQLLAHALLYGVSLGVYLDRALVSQWELREAM